LEKKIGNILWIILPLLLSSCETQHQEILVNTGQVVILSTEAAVVTGELTEPGGGIMDHGHYYSASPGSKIVGLRTSLGTVNKAYSYASELNNLDPGKTYYVCAYARSEHTAAFGTEISFTTEGLPELITLGLNEITDSTAMSGGTISNDWGFQVTVRGVCWNTTGNPSLDNNEGYTKDGQGDGSFTSLLSGLSGGTKYFLCAYATNSIGTAYGLEVIFETSLSSESETDSVTDYDGNEYSTVQIGAQCWMAENLKTTHYADGVKVPWIEGNDVWWEFDVCDKAYCYYNDDPSNGDKYGLLYTWAAVMYGLSSSNDNPSGVQGICPDGWHLPSESEWQELEIYLGMNPAQAASIGLRGSDQGSKLKAISGWSNDGNGTDQSGFNAIPGGSRGTFGRFYAMGNYAYFWSSTESVKKLIWIRQLYYYGTDVLKYDASKTHGYAVRCVKDE